MKKIILLLLYFVLSFSIFAQETKSGFEVSAYATNQYSVGELSKLSVGNLGGGIAAQYTIPALPLLGISARTDFAGVFPKQKRIKSWLNLTLDAGLFANINLTKTMSLRPEFDYGVMINFININDKNKIYADQIIQISAAFRFSTEKLKASGITFEVAPIYSLFLEKISAGHYLGGRAGVSFEF